MAAARHRKPGSLAMELAPVTPVATAHRNLGLNAAIALVVGNVVGTGIFVLPASLAAYGTISLVAMGLTTVGAIALALVFGRLGARIPAAGGPYAYARQAFGEFMGFWTAWSFWLTAWIGNAAIAIAWVPYVQTFIADVFGWDWGGTGRSIAIGLVGLWIPALVNLAGATKMALFQQVTTVLKFAPLLFVAVVGLFFMNAANFGPFLATGSGLPAMLTAISAAGAITLFIYSGVESVTIAAEKVKNPVRNIGLASLIGVLACAALYILSTVAVMGAIPHDTLVGSAAPFADAINAMFGGTTGGAIMSACAVISGIGALNGWTLLVAEMPFAAARDGMFPPAFARESGRGVPFVGVLAGTILTTLMLLFGYAQTKAFETVVLLASFTTAIPYFFSACAQLYWLYTGERQVSRGNLAKDIVIAVIAILFSFWIVYGSGADAVLLAMLAMLAGVPVYIWLKAKRGEYGPREAVLGGQP